jgi:predicted PurR-regulated permease PerM
MSAAGGPVSGADERAAAAGHNEHVGQPHDSAVEGPIAAAEATAERISTDDAPMGRIGKPFNWRAPFFIGIAATAGVALTVGGVELFLLAGNTLILIGLALFLAIGMEPAVSFLARHGFPRWAAVLTVILVILAAIGGFIAAAVPAVVTQTEQLIQNIKPLFAQLNDKSSFLGSLNSRFGLQEKVQSFLSDSGPSLASGVLGAGEAVFSAFADALIVMVLTIYFLADLPRIRAFLYRFVPHSRRPRAILIGDDIMAKVGGYVLGNLVVSLVAGVLTFGWLLAFGVPYALLLAILVALLDLVPVVGSTVAGIIVAAVALTVSLPVCIATVAFFIVYRLAEDYLLVPRIIGKAVKVPDLVTVVAVLIGGALLGILGALVAIPIAAAILLLIREMLFPRLDER